MEGNRIWPFAARTCSILSRLDRQTRYIRQWLVVFGETRMDESFHSDILWTHGQSIIIWGRHETFVRVLSNKYAVPWRAAIIPHTMGPAVTPENSE